MYACDSYNIQYHKAATDVNRERIREEYGSYIKLWQGPRNKIKKDLSKAKRM